ncbi:hypothetical protein BpHYR1_021421 [Brachionus plicatilis]|uniref:RNA-directed DNA polymerase from mobile element jockey-like n=1 Tax=Brachionus plicatilis TaxID=10195 RepID=A0A3M7Q407_BRAPC|nr:hypothetical protein BpHYR1_021421 [Brachionus plicatilis]
MAIPNQVPRARKRPNPKWFNPKIKVLTRMKDCKLQPKLLYNYINSQKQCRDSIKGLLDCLVPSTRMVTRSFFIPRLPCPAQPLQLTASPQHNMDVDFFSPASVLKNIMRLNPRKSPGMDGILPFMSSRFRFAMSHYDEHNLTI